MATLKNTPRCEFRNNIMQDKGNRFRTFYHFDQFFSGYFSPRVGHKSYMRVAEQASGVEFTKDVSIVTNNSLNGSALHHTVRLHAML